MDDLERLTKSCERLPKFIELHAPTCIIVAEIRILTDCAFSTLQKSLNKDFDSYLQNRRATDGRKQKKD